MPKKCNGLFEWPLTAKKNDLTNRKIRDAGCTEKKTLSRFIGTNHHEEKIECAARTSSSKENSIFLLSLEFLFTGFPRFSR